ncbi:cuticle protein 38-like [Anopheles funestus]|uniref:cuticle protein 38-like n=1 Tax=Anopheles funestus TaxID=62324 RepID=UPI0020C5DB08|nr:cuticle protein 38-like [Anopheles funestus]
MVQYRKNLRQIKIQSVPFIMKSIAALVAVMGVVVIAEAGYIAPYTDLAHTVHDTGAYYDDHYAPLAYAAPAYAAPYAAYYGNPSGTYSYWGSHGPTVVQENAASLPAPIHGAHPYAPYASLYGTYGPVKTTVVQANVASSLANHWGYPAAYGAYGYGYGYGYNKYLADAAPLTKYLL